MEFPLKHSPREQVVILSSIDWDSAWQRHHIFASAFVADGRDVYFIENTGFRNPLWKDWPRILRRIQNMLSPSMVEGANPIPAGVRVITPRALPPTWSLFRVLNSRIFLPALDRRLRAEGVRDGAACIAYVATATTIELVRRLAPSVVLYDCASNFRAYSLAPGDMLERERELLGLTDQVVCDSDFLYEQKIKEHPFVEKIHQGVPDDFFGVAPAPTSGPGKFCYYGTWSRGLDSKFVDALANDGVDVTVRGFSKGDAPALSSSVHRLPPVAREEVAASLAPYAGFILPYRVSPYEMGVMPAKIYECLATGRPVIATPLPALKALEDLIYIGETPEDWRRIVRGLAKTENADLRRARIAMARKHSSINESKRFIECLDAARSRRAQRVDDPGMDLVMLSPISWPRATAARRAEAAAWAATGRRVFFIELDSRAWTHRLRRTLFGAPWAETAGLPRGVQLAPALLLPATSRLWREANAALLAPRVTDLLHDRGLDLPYAVAVTADSPHIDTLLSQLKPALVLRADSEKPQFEALLEQAHAFRGRAAAPPSEEKVGLPAFLSGLGWIGILYGLAKASTLLTQICAGRWLGPLEYGRANLVMAAAAYLQIIPMLGFPTAIGKFLASHDDDRRRARFISSALALFGLWLALGMCALTLGHHALADALSLSPRLFAAALFLAASNAVYVVTASPLLGLKRFAHRGLVEATYGLTAPAALIVAVWIFGPTYEAMISALGAGFILGAGYALWCQRRYLLGAFDPKVLNQIWSYAAVATLNLLAVACVLAPARFVLHMVRGPEEVGLFSAYFTATIQVSLALLYMLQSVIVPMASDPRGQLETWALVKHRAPAALLGTWILFLVVLLGALAVFGHHYPLRWDWVLLFSTAATLALAHGTLSALYSARDFSGLRISVIGGLLTGLTNVGLTAALIPARGVSGAAIALVASFALGLFFFLGVRGFEARR